jgi:hypothetical protein
MWLVGGGGIFIVIKCSFLHESDRFVHYMFEQRDRTQPPTLHDIFQALCLH